MPFNGLLTLPDLERAQDGNVLVWSARAGRPLWAVLTGALLTGFVANAISVGQANGSEASSTGLTWDGSTFATTGSATIAGRIGVAAALSSIALAAIGDTGTASPLSGTNQQGFRADITGTSAATAAVLGAVGLARTAAAAFTCGLAAGGYFAFSTLGGGSTATRATGAVVERATAGTNQAGLVIIDGGGSPAFTGNYSLIVESTTKASFGGTLLVGTATDDGVNKLQVAGSAALTAGSGAATVSLTGAGANEARLRLGGGTGHYNWHVGPNFTVNQAFEITPSTATGGSTFSTPSMLVFGATGAVVIGALTDDGANRVQIASDSTVRNCAIKFTDTNASGNAWIAGVSVSAVNGHFQVYDSTGAALRFQIAKTTGDTTIASTTDSTAVNAGSLIVAGGLGVAKRLTLDGATGKTLRIVNAAANAAVATTLGSVGPTGSTAGNPQGWMRIDIAGTDRYIPFW